MAVGGCGWFADALDQDGRLVEPASARFDLFFGLHNDLVSERHANSEQQAFALFHEHLLVVEVGRARARKDEVAT